MRAIRNWWYTTFYTLTKCNKCKKDFLCWHKSLQVICDDCDIANAVKRVDEQIKKEKRIIEFLDRRK